MSAPIGSTDHRRATGRSSASRVLRPPLPVALPVVGLVLLAGLWGGLGRLGWTPPGLRAPQVAQHGGVLALGLFGTLIAAERAVALRRRWAFAAPAASAAGALALVLGAPPAAGRTLLVTGAAIAAVATALVWRLQPETHNVALLLAALVWVAGAVLWAAGAPVWRATPWWAAFLVLTIAAERLELARLAGAPGFRRRAFAGAVGLVLGGLALSTGSARVGAILVGLGWGAVALWLVRYDVARRTIAISGLPRFIAACLLAGYAWLAVAGALCIRAGDLAGGPGRDAALHALFLGFVMSMVFAHAPVIVPAVLGVSVPYTRWFATHVLLLHGSLVARVFGDLAARPEIVRWAGVVNVVAVLTFAAATAAAAVTARAPGVPKASLPNGGVP